MLLPSIVVGLVILIAEHFAPAVIRVGLWTLYGLAALVSLGNLLLMMRPRAREEGPEIRFLIPARNEAENLAALLPQLVPQGAVTVFDDESTDATAKIAAAHGATVLHPSEGLPEGWTGKNRACHELGLSRFPEPYLCFLDADVRVTPDFSARLRSTARENRVTTAFPTIVHGRFPEPVVLGWVGWSLLALNPFFLVQLTGKGHNRFTNGQIALWPADLYRRLRPNERVRGQILEDVLIGRLLAAERVPVLTANLASSLSTAMYADWRGAYDGMSKNSYEITGNRWGNAALAGLLALLGIGPFLMSDLYGETLPFERLPETLGAYGLLLVSALATTRLCRGNLLYAPLFPFSLLCGAIVLLRSHAWRLLGKTSWKGRVYRTG